MNFKIKFLLLFLFFITICWSLPRKVFLTLACREVVYDHYQLALTWPNEYCSENFCIPDWNRYWDGKSLVIHGLWPSSGDLGYLSCLM